MFIRFVLKALQDPKKVVGQSNGILLSAKPVQQRAGTAFVGDVLLQVLQEIKRNTWKSSFKNYIHFSEGLSRTGKTRACFA